MVVTGEMRMAMDAIHGMADGAIRYVRRWIRGRIGDSFLMPALHEQRGERLTSLLKQTSLSHCVHSLEERLLV